MTNKPITVRRMELINKLCNAVNESGLPAFAIADILERMLREANQLAQEEYNADLKAYTSEKDEEQAEPS